MILQTPSVSELEYNLNLAGFLVKSLHDQRDIYETNMEFFLESILEIRSEFPQQCNPNLLACAIRDFLKSSALAEHIRNSQRRGETSDQTRMRLLRQSMLYLGFSVNSQYGRDVFPIRDAA